MFMLHVISNYAKQLPLRTAILLSSDWRCPNDGHLFVYLDILYTEASSHYSI